MLKIFKKKFHFYLLIIGLLCGSLLILDAEQKPNQLRGILPEEALQALDQADHVTLYSLDTATDAIIPIEPPNSQKQDNTSPAIILPPKEEFNGYKVFGKVDLDNSDAKRATEAFQDALVKWNHNPIPRCFEPHHGLRININSHTFDYILCYKCTQIRVVEDGKWIASAFVKGSPDVLNALLTSAHIHFYSPP